MIQETESKSKASREDLLGQVANEFFEQLAQGQNPRIEEYAKCHPEIAEQIRLTFPALELVGESISSSGSNPHSTNARAEQKLGDFRIGREIGRGGMGIVYEAEQLSMGRTVALKVLPFAAVMDEKAIIRFKNESRAAGTLHHENIVPVHAVGNERGVHYYAMALIHGLTVAEVIGELKQRVVNNKQGEAIRLLVDQVVSDKSHLPGETCNSSGQAEPTIDSAITSQNVSTTDEQETVHLVQRALSTHRSLFHSGFYQQVARIGIQAADALHHAHEYGIVHRDIKPGNLMIDGAGKVWVTDFGLARIESDAGMTMTGDLLGTLRYMAPEQALAKRIVVDHRADIYSLGVTLYELLTLRPVYDAANREALLKQLTFEDPKPIRQFHPSVPADLETIVLKAIAKNPDERYATAVELADDLRAFQEDQPIKAKPLTMLQRSRKWALRHQVMVAATAVVLLVSTLALAVSTLAISREQSQTEAALTKAEDNFEEAIRQRKLAEENFQRAREAVDKYLTRVSEDQLLNASGLQPLRKGLLELALEYYRQFIAERSDDPELQIDLAAAYYRVGEIAMELGNLSDAKEALQKALDLRRSLAERNARAPEPQHALAESYLAVANDRFGDDDATTFDEIENAIELTKPLDDPLHRATLGEAYLALGHAKIGHFLQTGGVDGMEEARVALQNATQIFEELQHERPGIQHLKGLSEVYREFGEWHQRMGHRNEYEKYLRLAIETNQRLIEEAPEKLEYQSNIADHYSYLGEYDAAMDILKKLAEENSSVVEYQRQLADCHRCLGLLHKDPDELQKAVEIYKRLSRDYSDTLYVSRLGLIYNDLGHLLFQTGRVKESITAFQSSIDTLSGRDHSQLNLADFYMNLSDVHEKAGNLDAAISAMRSSAALYLKVLESKPEQLHWRSMTTHRLMRLGALWRQLDDQEQSLAAYRQADNLMAVAFEDGKTPNGSPPQISEAQYFLYKIRRELAAFLIELGRRDDAAIVYRRGIDQRGKMIELAPTDAGNWRARGLYYYDLGEDGKALADLSRAIQLNPTLYGALKERSWVYHRMGKFDLALADVTAAIERKPDKRYLYLVRARVHRSSAQFDLALVDCQQAIDIDPENDATWFTRVSTYELRGDIYAENLQQYENAVAEYSKAIELEPDNRYLYLVRARVHRCSTQFDLALVDCQQAIDIDPENDATWFTRASAYELRGDIYAEDLQQYENAVAEYSKAIELEPLNSTYSEKRGHAFQESGDTERAASDFDEAKRKNTT